MKDLFDSELMLAETLAAKQLAKDAASVNALLAMTMLDGLRADYAALIERKDGASLAYTKKGRKSAEKLLMVDSGCYDVPRSGRGELSLRNQASASALDIKGRRGQHESE